MNKEIFIRISLILSICLSIILATSCSDSDNNAQHYIKVSESEFALNKLGTDDFGKEAVVYVNASIYWQMTIEEGSEWISSNIIAGVDDVELKLKVGVNDTNVARQGKIKLEAIDGTFAVVSISQKASTEAVTYLVEEFDEEEKTNMPIVDYDELVGWTPTGVSASGLRFRGDNAILDNSNPSKGYDGASGKNNILLGTANSNIQFGAVDLLYNKAFTIQFGAMTKTSSFDKDKLKFYVSKDNIYWSEVSYQRSTKADWDLATSEFYFTDEILKLYFKIEAEDGSGFRVDDISLLENNMGNGEEIDFSIYINDGKPIGHVYYETDFSWSFSGTDWVAKPSGSNKEVRFDAAKGDQKDALDANGWKTRESNLYAYLRPGYIKLGRTNDGGHVISPTMKIDAGAVVNGILTFDATMYASAGGAKDLDGITVEVVNGGTIGDLVTTAVTMDVETWNSWRTMELKLYGITSETQIAFRAKHISLTGVNRFFLDNVKIVKGPRK